MFVEAGEEEPLISPKWDKISGTVWTKSLSFFTGSLLPAALHLNSELLFPSSWEQFICKGSWLVTKVNLTQTEPTEMFEYFSSRWVNPEAAAGLQGCFTPTGGEQLVVWGTFSQVIWGDSSLEKIGPLTPQDIFMVRLLLSSETSPSLVSFCLHPTLVAVLCLLKPAAFSCQNK